MPGWSTGVDMNTKEETTIKNWHESLQEPIQLTLILTESDQNEIFDNYAKTFTHLAPTVEIKKEKKDTADPPSFRIGSNIFYHALPKDKELDPFLEILTPKAHPESPDTEELDAAKNIDIPAELNLFIAIQCGFCPTVVRNLSRLAKKNSLIRLSIIDVALFPEMVKENDIRAVPTVLLDRQFRWSGSFPMEDVVRMMAQRSPEQLSASSILNMIEDGAAGRVVQMMIDYNQIFPSFYDLIVHEKWPVRLGAMVAMETLAEEQMELATSAVQPLMKNLEETDDLIKGDILYLLGIIGYPEIIRPLKVIVADTNNPELADALQEAIAEIKKRYK